MKIDRKNLKLGIYFVLLLTTATILNSKEYRVDGDGNLNIEVSQGGVVRVNGEVQSVVHPNEEITVIVDEHSNVMIGNDELDIEMENDVSVNDDEIAVDLEEIGVGDVFIDDEGISVGDVYVGDDDISLGGLSFED